LRSPAFRIQRPVEALIAVVGRRPQPLGYIVAFTAERIILVTAPGRVMSET
jgi:hypothetical protein